MNNVCINCAYFLNCNEAEKNKEICKKYIKAQRKIILVIISTAMLFCLCGCTTESVAETEKRFITISNEGTFYIVYDKETKVEYALSASSYNYGVLTVLVDAEGKPLLYKEK